MTKMLLEFLAGLLKNLFEFCGQDMLNHMSRIALNLEKHLVIVGNIYIFDNLFKIFASVGISLIVIKFLKKGFDMYILWSDGDPDADPVLLVTNFVKAIAIALTFTVLYNIFTDIMYDIIDQVLASLNLKFNEDTLFDLFVDIQNVGISGMIGYVIFFIMYLILYIKFALNGFELLILRIGGPLACVGLMDSDKGVFRTYMQKFIQVALTIIVQLTLAKLSLLLIIKSQLLLGLSAVYFATTTPKFIKEFVIFTGGGGISNTVYQSARMAEMTKRYLVRK